MGTTGFLFGGLVGVVISAANPSETFVINGDPARFSAYQKHLNNRARYSLPPPEIANRFALDTMRTPAEITPISASAPSSEAADQQDAEPISLSTGTIHLYVSFPVGTSNAADDMDQAYSRAGFGGRVVGFLGPVTYPASYANDGYWSYQAEYSVTPRLRLGAHWSDLRGADVSGIHLEEEEVSGETYGALVKYILSPAAIPGNRFEFAGAAGLDWNKVKGSGHLGYLYDPFVSANHAYTFDDELIGFRLEFSLDVYFARYFSFQSKVGGAWMGDVNVPRQSTTINEQSRTLPGHGINLSREYFALGLGLHI